MSAWEIVYKRAFNADGSLFFPEKLTHEFLEQQKRTQGSYIYSNQYLNEIIPAELQTFKRDWIKYYSIIPEEAHNFIFIDPAISQADSADFTGIVVVAVDSEKRWYIRYARRHKITPTQLITTIFLLNREFKPQVIGIEDVAYQKSLLYFLEEEVQRRQEHLPVKGIKPPSDKTKQMRILSLVPRFEWGRIFLNQGLNDLELELMQFPRGSHDDVIDALAGVEYISYPPVKETDEERWRRSPPGPNHKDYERYYRHKIVTGGNFERSEEY